MQPDVASEPASAINTTGATLHGFVEPDLAHGGGDATSCQFEYVSEQAFRRTATNTPRPRRAKRREPLPYSQAESVSATVSSLSPSTTYHYRVVAADEAFPREQTTAKAKPKPEETLTTPGPPGRDAESSSPHCKPRHPDRADRPLRLQHSCEVQFVHEAKFVASGYEHARASPVTRASARTPATSPPRRRFERVDTRHDVPLQLLRLQRPGHDDGRGSDVRDVRAELVHARNARLRRTGLHPGGRSSLCHPHELRAQHQRRSGAGDDQGHRNAAPARPDRQPDGGGAVHARTAHRIPVPRRGAGRSRHPRT